MRQGSAWWWCAGAWLVCVVLGAGAGAQPTLSIADKDTVWDLTEEGTKETVLGEKAEHDFFVENTGTEPLTISEATTDGSSVTAVLPDGPIEPGKGAPLKVIFDTEALQPGRYQKYVVVKSNDPARKDRPLVLTVKATVVPKPETQLLVEPRVRNIGLVRVGEAKEFTYKYHNAGSKEVEVYPLYFVDKRFRIVKDIEREVLVPSPEPKEFRLEFRPEPRDAGRELDAVFIVKTGSPDQPRVICRVRGYVASKEKGVQIIPRFVGAAGPAVEARYVFWVVNNTQRTVEVVARRGETELRRLVMAPEERKAFDTKVAGEEALKEIAFDVNLAYVAPEPPEPPEPTEPAEATEETTAEEASAEEGAPEEAEAAEEEAPEDEGGEEPEGAAEDSSGGT